MSWQRRLMELALAGGAVSTLAGCPGIVVGCGNANPDPCICGRPERDPREKMACDEKKACEAAGGTWDPFAGPSAGADAAVPACSLPVDGGPPDAH
jgi:hypothetical protein